MIIKKTLTATLLALSIGNAFAAETSAVEHNTQAFLNALAAGVANHWSSSARRTPAQY